MSNNPLKLDAVVQEGCRVTASLTLLTWDRPQRRILPSARMGHLGRTKATRPDGGLSASPGFKQLIDDPIELRRLDRLCQKPEFCGVW